MINERLNLRHRVCSTAVVAIAVATLVACKAQPPVAVTAQSPPKSSDDGRSRLEETFSPKYGETVLRGWEGVGRIDAERGGAVAVAACETRNVRTREHMRGIVIYLSQATDYNRNTATAYIDYDEIPSLLSAITYISKVDHTSTRFQTFQAEYAARGGLSITTVGPPSGSTTAELAVGSVTVDIPAERLANFNTLLSQAKAIVDAKTSRP